MIKHTVMYKLKDSSPEACEKAKEMLMSMSGKVEQLKSIYVGIDTLRSERSFDLILDCVFEDLEGLRSYKSHPYHASTVKPYMHSVFEKSVSVDSEF
ncbi:MAG: Dabb family protein [Clostridia bacterium]|nr:Dabb family protein [Clostridia bacterium]